MLIYTVQPLAVLLKVIQENVLYSQQIIVKARTHSDVFLEAYGWLIPQMRQRVPSAHVPHRSYPWWGWYKYGDSVLKPKFSHSYYRGLVKEVTEPYAIITLDIPDENVLLSDYDAWHWVLSKWFFGFQYEETALINAFCKEFHLLKKKFRHGMYLHQVENYPAYKEQFQKTWERCFDLDISRKLVRTSKLKQYIQACFWELRRNQIADVRIKGGPIQKVLRIKPNQLDCFYSLYSEKELV